MSWISSNNATSKQNSKNDLSFYHGFSKTPVEPNTSNGSAVTTLANASTKSGHTVSATEVWASEIPWFGLVPSKAVAVTRLSGITKKNDLVRVNGDKDYIYIGKGDEVFTEATWSTYWSPITLTNGMELENQYGDKVLRYYEKQQMQALEPNNNAGIDSKGFATRLFVDESKNTAVTTVGQGSVISQFVAGTDNIKNGIASSELNPVLYLGDTQKIAGTHYYDYNVSGTILWNANVKSSNPKITCFRYIGKTVTQQVSEISSTVKTHSSEISEIKDKLGLGDTGIEGTPTLGGRVTDNETALRILLGLEDNAKVVATESISNSISAAEGRVKVTTDALAGRIAQLEGITHFSVVVVPEGQTIENVTPLVENTIYLVKDANAAEGTYIEYIAYKPAGSSSGVTEKIGSTAIDLSGYTTDAEHEALQGRVSTTEGQIATITSTDVTKEGSIAKALADAKTYAEGQASAAKSGAEATAASALSTARTQITAEIAAAKEQAIAGSTVKITASTAEGKTGIEITPNGEPSNAFTVGINQSIIATVASVTAISNIITDNKKEIDGKISNINGILDGLKKGDDSIYAKIRAVTDRLASDGDIGQAIASKVASVTLGTVPTGVSLGTDTKNPVLSIVTATSTETAGNGTDAQKLVTGEVAKGLAQHYATLASNGAVNTIDGRSLATTSTQGSYVTVKTSGTVGSGLVVTVDDSALTSAYNASASAIQTVKVNGSEITKNGTEVDITAIVGVASTSLKNGINLTEDGNKVGLSVTPATYDVESGTWSEASYFTTAGDISTVISSLSERLGNMADVQIAEQNTVKGLQFNTFSSGYKYLSVSPATYTPSSETGLIGTWSDTTENYLVTGATVAAAIGDVNAKVDALHKTPQFKVEIVPNVTDLTKWEESVTDGIKENYIYLVANAEAADGSYIEFIAYKNGDTIVTERIGTTKTDLSGYVKTVTINGQSYTATANNAGTINIGKAASSIATGQATTIANQGSVYGHIAENGTLTLGVASATDSVMGVSKLFTNGDILYASTNITDTAVSVHTAQTMYSTLASLANGKVGSVQGTNYLKLAGLAVNTNDNDVTISTIGIYGSDFLPPTTVKVENGMVYASNGWTHPLNTNDIVNGEEFLQGRTTFTSWVSDLSNMTKGISMFKNCTSLTTFVGDLSSLVSADGMFYGCTLDAESLEILADTLPTVTSGTIDIGASTNATPDVIATIKAKGWTLKSNGTAL